MRGCGTRFGAAMLAGAVLAGMTMVGVTWAGAAWADVTAEQAAGVQRDLRGWIVGLLSPLVEAGQVPVTVVPAGDRFRMEFGAMPVPGMTVTMDRPAGAFLRGLGDGRWAMEAFTMPAQLDVMMADEKTPFYSLRIGTQRARLEIDTTLATASRGEAEYSQIEQILKGGESVSKIAQISTRTQWQPGASGMMAMSGESRMTGYDARETLPDGTVLMLKAREIAATTRGEAMRPDRFAGAMRLVARLAASVQASQAPDGQPSAAQRKMLHALLAEASEVFARVEMDQTWSGVSLMSEAMSGSLETVTFGTAMGAPGGKTEFGLKLEVAGFDSAMVPKGAMRELMPKRVMLAPRVSGPKKADVVALLERAIDNAGDDDFDMADEAMQLLAGNPAVVSLDGLEIDLGMSRLRASGQLAVASAEDVTGKGEVRMTGLDALIRTLGKVPEAAMAGPVLLMLKGLGEQKGTETVWRITYAANKVLVNGQDLSALLSGGN